ncbi:hypothetical protein JX265_003210 [Neoarthrinium moseri]|uniref:AB hydrolase-1 domain-containing protein n=1 Tax=Neoarthrinium moseri TaxID=1658444 RepID=A0A9P9WTG9_9PEZI|nr:hypothetical protein JX265_003210 [Neoarthrinium moseri]
MLVNHNPFTYALVVAGKYLVGYVGLGCFLYFVVALFVGNIPAISHPFSITVEVYGAIEILWYFIWFLPFKAYLQRPGLSMIPTTRAQRKALIERLLNHVPNVRLFIRKWFNDAHLDEVYRDDVKDWLLWALWGVISDTDIDPDELEEYVCEAESRSGLTLPRGRAGARPMRLSLDPVKMIHRSLLWYALLGIVDNTATLLLIFNGFGFWRQPRISFLKVFPFRIMTLFSTKESVSPHFSYVYRPHKSNTHRPIVFCHGIGIGLSTYFYWLRTIPKEIGVLALEFLPVSGRICPESVSQEDYVKAMRQILSQQDINDFVFVGHSYGTFLARPLLDDTGISLMINSLILIDPAAILMHLPDTAYNITRKQPLTAPEVQIAWGAALDPRTAHTVCRRIHWPEHILWRENLAGKRTTAIVAGRDCVINAGAVAGYMYYGDTKPMTSADLIELRKTPRLWTGTAEFELIYLFDRDHGQSLLIPSDVKKITNTVETYARLDYRSDKDREENEAFDVHIREEVHANSKVNEILDSNVV